VLLLLFFCFAEAAEAREAQRITPVVDEVRTRDFQNTRPQEIPASPFQQYDGCTG